MTALKQTRRSHTDEPGFPVKWLVAVGSVLAIVAIGFSGWYLLIRDTWEQDHAIQLHRLSLDVVMLADAGKESEALAKSDELKSMLGNRAIADSELAAVVSQAVERSVLIASTLEALQVADNERRIVETIRQTLNALENKGGQREQLGNWESALVAYREALDAIKQRGPTDRAFAEDSRRITQSIERVEAALATQKQREQESAARVAEAAKLASMRATISGGAWVTRKAGSSDVLRGIEVFAAARWVDAAHTVEFHEAAIAAGSAKLDEWKAKLAEQEASSYEPLIWRTKELIALIEEQLKASRESLAAARNAPPGTQSDLHVLAMRLPENPTVGEELAFYRIVAKNLRGSTHADIDGRYKLVVPGGDSCIVATFDSENSRIFWCEVVRVADDSDRTVDLRNSNAMSIWNKPPR